MKQSLQLRFSQQLTMTPQLQQAIRLLQLSTLDLKQEIQDALESNLMLELDEEGSASSEKELALGEFDSRMESEGAALGSNDANNEREIDAESTALPEELPVDSGWDDVYDSILPASSGSGSDGEDHDYLSQNSAPQTLRDHLQWQLNLAELSDREREIAGAIVDAIDDDGYLRTDLEDLIQTVDGERVAKAEVERVLAAIQEFDPPGIAARDLRECLLLQLRQLPEAEIPWCSHALRLLERHFDLLAKQDFTQIKRKMGMDDEDLAEVMKLIRTLSPRPGTQVASAAAEYVVPDVFVSRRGGSWHVDLNPDATPKLRVNPAYTQFIRRADSSDDNVTLKNHLQEARWFIKSLVNRNETLLRVATKIVEFQRGFFEHGDEAMRPLVLRDIADALEMHESTVSRVTTQKYMHTPRGTYEFKYFFSSHVSTAGGGECSATAIRALIKKLIAAERPERPLSDSQLANILADQGIQVARRTVAKYREAMAIPPSSERKRLA